MAPEPAHTTRGQPAIPFKTRSRSARSIMRTPKRVVVFRAQRDVSVLCLSFLAPNFMYWCNRFKIVGGRVPTSHDPLHAWHDALGQSASEVANLEDWLASLESRVCLDGERRPSRVGFAAPNLPAESTIHVLKSHWVELGTGRNYS